VCGERREFRLGDELDVSVAGGVITMVAKRPPADDEYTSAQRRAVDAELTQGLEDVKHGRAHDFGTAEEAIAFLHAGSSKKAKIKKATKPRV